ncbi:MAG: prepilin-type N-terminal cleavage/methylation domain-containing protein, partial [Candidatus Absconditabacteria bacterium]
MANRLQKFLKSFTLIELIIVIAIIAVLGVSAFLLLSQWISKGRDTRKISDIQTIQKSLEIRAIESGIYPMPDGEVIEGTIDGAKL